MSETSDPHGISVVGSLSYDLVLTVPRRPNQGETLTGSTFNTFFGGKGNNQALAAALAGSAVTMIGKVGNDSHGDEIEANLKKHGVNVDHLLHDPSIGTGIANIWVEPNGSNSIVVVPQANGRLKPEEIRKAEDAIAGSKVLLLQMEIPQDCLLEAAKIAKSHGVLVVLNPAPAPSEGFIAGLLESADMLVPNQSEAELLTGLKILNRQDAEDAARELLALGPKTVIVTLGEDGVLFIEDGKEPEFQFSFHVKAIDSTAAGDAFCGALVGSIAQGDSLSNAVRRGSAAGALACTKPGAAQSLPSADEIEQLLNTAVS